MTDEHLSPLTIARLATDEAEGLAPARAHAEACDRCRAEVAAARAQDVGARAAPDFAAMWARIEAEASSSEDAADESAPADRTAVVVAPPPTLGSGLRAGLGAAAALAAAVLLFVVARPGDSADPMGVRLKGGPSLTLWDPSTERALDGAPAPEAAFRVRATCAARCVVRLFHQAGEGAPTPLPEGSATLEPGQPTLLGLTARVTPGGGPERLVALFCAAPPGAEALADPASAGCLRRERALAP